MLESIEIRVAENGFTVSCRERPDEDKKSGKDSCCGPMWTPPKDSVFESVDGALAYVKAKLNGSKPKYESLADRVKTKKKGA
jgi:hypothetical protein